MNNFYTYVLINSLDNMPIYIGKGSIHKNGKDRAESHFKNIKNHKHCNLHLQNKVLKIWENGGEVIAKKLYAESEQDSFDTEIHWIKFAKQLGCKLCNMTDGGEGTSGYRRKVWNKGKTGTQVAWNKGIKPSEETKKKMKGRIVSKETRDKLRKANIGKYHTEETKKKMSESGKGKHNMPRTEEWKKKMSESAKRIWRIRNNNEIRS